MRIPRALDANLPALTRKGDGHEVVALLQASASHPDVDMQRVVEHYAR